MVISMRVFRCFVEKKEGCDVEAQSTLRELRDFLGVTGLDSLRILSRYDIEGITEEIYHAARDTVFAQPQTDIIYDESIPAFVDGSFMMIVEALPGQYDQRADACAQCLQMLAFPDYAGRPLVRAAKVYLFNGDINEGDMQKLRGYIVNPLESREISDSKLSTLSVEYPDPKPVGIVKGFITADDDELQQYLGSFALAMDIADIRCMQEYFRDTEKRDPTVTELRAIDTYWSDHCRHTTFFTHITDVAMADQYVEAAYEKYLAARREVYGPEVDDRPQSLMDIATMASKVLKGRGMLKNMEISEEVNACSIHIDAKVAGKTEDWLLMFKNETHNHPTEVEPFGGAATCVGGAIRDPLSGRAYVYQAMRITGAGDPRASIEDTLTGKIPQRKLTLTAAKGNSSYGNQIGLTAGFVRELYHPGYIAKRMELGAVVGAVKAADVIRARPSPGDKVILLGGRTGRDGIGGATGSSKSQTTESHVTMAAEVQKGNAQDERNIQRLFLDPEVTLMIKKCNDFGAGGVSVAVGELADGLDIDLSLVRTKYGGLDGTEIAISESQERMAVVVAPENVSAFIEKATAQNLEAYTIAEVTESPRIVMHHDGKVIMDISREFLSTNGAVKSTSIRVPAPEWSGIRGQEPVTVNPDLKSCVLLGDSKQSHTGSTSSAVTDPGISGASFVERLEALVSDLDHCSQRGLQEHFDDTAGGSSVLVMNGGKTRSTPIQVMAALLPVQGADTSTCSVMAYGFDPHLSVQDPFTGAKTAVITSMTKLVAAGCDPDSAYLTFQEFFERLNDDPTRWGKPFSALLGAFEAQMELQIAAIGGKDSMSGSFNDLDVPPTLVSFAIAPNDAANVISPEFKEAEHDVVIFNTCGSLAEVKSGWKKIHDGIVGKTIVSAWAITEGGAAEGIFNMTLGNEIGFEYTSNLDPGMLFEHMPGSLVAEVTMPVPGAVTIGRTIPQPIIKVGEEQVPVAKLKTVWENVLEDVFPTKPNAPRLQTGANNDISANHIPTVSCASRPAYVANGHFAKPNVLVFILPGTTDDIATVRAVRCAGGAPRTVVFRNMTPSMIEESITEAVRAIGESQILILPGGASFGDEPDGSAKFTSIFFRNPAITDAIHKHLQVRDGLILGICEGFQTLVKLGLLPFGEILPPSSDVTVYPTSGIAASKLHTGDLPISVIRACDRPAFTRNTIGRHQSKYAYTRIASVKSPWMSLCNVGDVHIIPMSHSEGRFIAADGLLAHLISDGRIATQYVDSDGNPSMDIMFNPNGSLMAVEGLLSPDGRVLGKMGHTERYGEFTAKNVYGEKRQPIFESGINYFK